MTKRSAPKILTRDSKARHDREKKPRVIPLFADPKHPLTARQPQKVTTMGI